MVLLSLSALVFIGAYSFYGYQLFSKEGFDGIAFSLFFAESLLFATGFMVISSIMKQFQDRFVISFFLLAIVPFVLSMHIILRHRHS